MFISFVALILGLNFLENFFILLDSSNYSHLINISLATSFLLNISVIFSTILRAERKVKTIALVKIFQLLVTVLSTILLVVYFSSVEGVLIVL